MASETEWLLFIDESGQFARRGERVCVAGLLLREAERSANVRGMRQLLDQALPGVAFPQHARDLNREGFHLATWMRRGGPAWGGEDARALGRMAEAVRTSQDPYAVRFAAAVAADGDPLYEDLEAVEAILRRTQRADVEVLRGAVEGAREGMGAALRRLGTVYPAQDCFVVAAAESQALDAEALGARDRYLRLLQVLFERVYALLRAAPPARHKVWVRAAQRDVKVAEGLTLRLRAQDVGGAIRAAERSPPLAPSAPADQHVRLVPMQPPAYDAEVHPGVVFADFLANLLREPLGRAPSVKRLRQDGAFRGALPLEARPAICPDRSLPTAAADGAPRTAICGAFRAEPVQRLSGVNPGWAREQAEAWIEAAGVRR